MEEQKTIFERLMGRHLAKFFRREPSAVGLAAIAVSGLALVLCIDNGIEVSGWLVGTWIAVTAIDLYGLMLGGDLR